jgi:type II secretory pathway component PulC
MTVLRVRLPLLLTVGIIAAMFWHLHTWRHPGVPASETVPALMDARDDMTSDALARSLANPLLPTVTLPTAAIAAAGPSSLSARLRGVSTGFAFPLAIIEYEGQTHVLGEGGVLESNVQLHQIFSDHVVLQHNGRKTVLPLYPEAGTEPGPHDLQPETAQAGRTDGVQDEDMARWLNDLSEADPDTAVWVRERMKELHDREELHD